MPNQRSSLRSPSSNTRRRPPARRSTSSLVRRSLVPPQYQTDLVFYDYYPFASGGAAPLDIQTFRGNNPRDPQYAAGGGSCTGFARLATLYGRYRVTSVTAQFSGYSTCITPMIVGIRFRSPNGSAIATGPGAQQSLMEIPSQSVHTTLVPYAAGTSYPTFSLSKTSSISAILGHSDADNNYSALVTSDPVLECFLDYIIVSADGATVSVTANGHVRIIYHCLFSEPDQSYDD